MKKILRNALLASTALTFCAFSASAQEETGATEEAVLRGLRGAMEAVNLPLKVAKERAEDLYAYNGGADISGSGLNLGTNQYISYLSICSKYFIKMTFAGSRFNSSDVTGTDEVPLPKEIMGKTIYLVPVMAANDYLITTWECVTNFTLSQSMFKGDTKAGVKMQESTSTATRSILSKYTTDPVLQKCVYVADTSDFTAVGTAAGTCYTEG